MRRKQQSRAGPGDEMRRWYDIRRGERDGPTIDVPSHHRDRGHQYTSRVTDPAANTSIDRTTGSPTASLTASAYALSCTAYRSTLSFRSSSLRQASVL